MIFTPGIAVSQLSGSVGGTTASRNRGGAYFRNRAIPTNPSSPAQESVRAIMASQSQSWGDRTDAQRAAWKSWAVQNPVTYALGNSISLSGHQAYVQINSRLDLIDNATLLVPPVINAPLALDTLTLAADIGAGNVVLTFSASPLAADTVLWIEAAIVNSAGIDYVRNLFRFIGISPTAQTTAYDIETIFTTKFGAPIVGQTMHVRVATFHVPSGLKSVPLTSSAVVVSTV